MPTYEYACDACGETFERFQSINDAPLRVCPTCKKHRLRRLIGAGAGLLFKGSGFYQTDYRSSSYKNAASREQGSNTGEKSDSASGTSKPEPAKAGAAKAADD